MNVTQVLAAMAREIHLVETSAELTDRIGQYTRLAVDADDSGVLLLDRKQTTTTGSTSPKVEQAHALQVELNEGPCVDAIRKEPHSYICDDTKVDPRWPVWGPRAAAMGYSSVVSVRLEVNGRRLGSLNAYATRPAAFTAQDESTLQFLATHASVAIAAHREGQSLRQALDSRSIISQAQGMLMLAFDISAEQAFQYMRRTSQDSNRKLVSIAQQIVDDRAELRTHLTAPM